MNETVALAILAGLILIGIAAVSGLVVWINEITREQRLQGKQIVRIESLIEAWGGAKIVASHSPHTQDTIDPIIDEYEAHGQELPFKRWIELYNHYVDLMNDKAQTPQYRADMRMAAAFCRHKLPHFNVKLGDKIPL